jgi:hypothetical protein
MTKRIDDKKDKCPDYDETSVSIRRLQGVREYHQEGNGSKLTNEGAERDLTLPAYDRDDPHAGC